MDQEISLGEPHNGYHFQQVAGAVGSEVEHGVRIIPGVGGHDGMFDGVQDVVIRDPVFASGRVNFHDYRIAK